ncbi:MAG: hypothetical protein LBB82_10300 [Treponema sp.]|nr:hypothetical protein [Treponema sp.]
MELPLKRIALFSSGVGYFEHSGEAEKPEEFSLSFKSDAVNDVLKSLTINDPASDFPAVSYSSPESIEEALQSLKVGFSSERRGGLLDILDSLRGVEIEVSRPAPVLGRGRVSRLGFSGSSLAKPRCGAEFVQNLRLLINSIDILPFCPLLFLSVPFPVSIYQYLLLKMAALPYWSQDYIQHPRILLCVSADLYKLYKIYVPIRDHLV